MKKVCVLTLCGNYNFGNKLQNYAIINTLKKMNVDGYTIWIYNPFYGNSMKQFLKKIKHLLTDLFDTRNRIFLKFNKYLKIYNKKITYNADFKKIKNKFDFYIVGSDQVWNYNYFNNYDIFFLNKSLKNKNISFSASFGVNSIPLCEKDKYTKGLNNFESLSVREDRGKEIIEELTGRKDVEVLVDPTMLLTSEEWDQVSKKPKLFDKLNGKKYILNYFLGDLSEERKIEIERIAQENDCEIINILDKNDPFYVSGPSEFLYLEKNAFLICTDSFHSSVFAILYNRPFVVFDREQKGVENMNSRIDTLIDKFKLKNRRYNGKNITKENLEYDYTQVYTILEKERKKSDIYLKKSLKID